MFAYHMINSNSVSVLGEPFTQEEMDEMLSAAVDPDKGTVLYKDYASQMTIDEL